MNKSQKIKLLGEVRCAIHGWAFAPTENLPRRLAAGEAAVALLPPELRVEGEALLSGIRRRIITNSP